MRKIRFIGLFILALIIKILTIRRSFKTYPAAGTRKTARAKISHGKLPPAAIHHRIKVLFGKWYGAVSKIK